MAHTRKVLLAALHLGAVTGSHEIWGVDFEGEGYRQAGAVMQLHLMSDKGLSGMGAVCLDGSDAGFYFAPAADPKNAKDWQLYFEGGGWCYDEIDCWGRSNTGLGSSKSWGQTAGIPGGIMSSDCNSNPDLCNFNKVIMKYCDGSSFSGNADKPVVVNGLDGKDKPLYFRGRRILDAVLETLVEQFGLADAETVHFTGCSAGGLSTYLHTDYANARLRDMAPGLKKFRASPISGFFPFHNNIEGKPVYAQEMQYIFNLANSTHGVNDKCIAAMADADKWKCISAEMSYAFTESPIFALNSALDSWSTNCILTPELVPSYPRQNTTANGNCEAVPGWKACTEQPSTCDSNQIGVMNQYITDFDAVMEKGATYTKAGNGAFIHSCHTHCEAQNAAWNTFAINGVTIQQAFSKWWNSVDEPAANHNYKPCQFNTSPARQCNPSCGEPTDTIVI